MRASWWFLPTFCLLGSCFSDAEGPVVVLSDDRRSIQVLDSAGLSKSFDIVQICGESAVGEPTIRAFDVVGSTINVTYGKHCSATIDLVVGEVRCNGCD